MWIRALNIQESSTATGEDVAAAKAQKSIYVRFLPKEADHSEDLLGLSVVK
jgi:hypothetical protein